jgi:hypothetical protein
MSLRLKRNKQFGQRLAASETKSLIPIYLIAVAGEGKSEEKYFKGIRDYANELGITENIVIEPLEKEDEYRTKSHPKHIIKLLEERSNQWEEWGIEPNELWMIIDRDKQNVSEQQIRKIIDSCNSKGYNIALSNPAFELWLLLHFKDIDQYSEIELLKNRKISANRRFIEKEVSKLADGYSKSNLKFERFKDGIYDALNRANNLENNITELINKLGTNINILVDIILNRT